MRRQPPLVCFAAVALAVAAVLVAAPARADAERCIVDAAVAASDPLVLLIEGDASGKSYVKVSGAARLFFDDDDAPLAADGRRYVTAEVSGPVQVRGTFEDHLLGVLPSAKLAGGMLVLRHPARLIRFSATRGHYVDLGSVGVQLAPAQLGCQDLGLQGPSYAELSARDASAIELVDGVVGGGRARSRARVYLRQGTTEMFSEPGGGVKVGIEAHTPVAVNRLATRKGWAQIRIAGLYGDVTGWVKAAAVTRKPKALRGDEEANLIGGVMGGAGDSEQTTPPPRCPETGGTWVGTVQVKPGTDLKTGPSGPTWGKVTVASQATARVPSGAKMVELLTLDAIELPVTEEPEGSGNGAGASAACVRLRSRAWVPRDQVVIPRSR